MAWCFMHAMMLASFGESTIANSFIDICRHYFFNLDYVISKILRTGIFCLYEAFCVLIFNCLCISQDLLQVGYVKN